MQHVIDLLRYSPGRIGMALFGAGLILIFFASNAIIGGGFVLLYLGAALMFLTALGHRRITNQNWPTKTDSTLSLLIFMSLALVLVAIIVTLERMLN